MRHAGRGALSGRRGDIDDGTPALEEKRQPGANRADVAHHVQLPVRVPLLVRYLVEACLPGCADVVDEHVEAAERGRGFRDDPRRLTCAAQIRYDMQQLTHVWRFASAARDNPGSLRGEHAGGLQADAARGARDEAAPVAQAKVHGGE